MTATADNRAPGELAEVLKGLKLIDCDAHFTEPADLWTSRAPEKWQGRVPVHQTVDGISSWFLDGQPWASIGGNTIRRDKSKMLGSYVVQPFENIWQGSWEVKGRLELLDEVGVWAQILYPNGVGFSSNHIFAIDDLAQRAAILEMYNDFYAELQAESRGRLLPQAMLPVWDMDLCLKEMRRMLEAGIRGFTLTDRPELIGLPELPEAYFTPMWDLFNESGAVANFHVGAGARREDIEAIRNSHTPSATKTGAPVDTSMNARTAWTSLGRQRGLATHATQAYMSNVRIIANLCMSNLFDRFPKLKIVSAESGIGWVPFILEALEYQFDEMVTDEAELTATKARPTDYFRGHISVMFWFEKVAAQKLIEDVGVKNVLVETDIPHPTCLYPNPMTHFSKAMGELDPYVARRVVQDNAVELYNVKLPD
jgi:predicted TIM-barrel fold metal-dependent hydrolase